MIRKAGEETEYRKAHRDEINARIRAWRERNRDKVREQQRRYRERNREAINARQRARNKAQP